MDEDIVLSLFDIYWFYHKSSPTEALSAGGDIGSPAETSSFSPLRSLHRRSLSDQLSSKSDPFSPNSVLPIPHLETILSGKVSSDTPTAASTDDEPIKPPKKPLSRRKNKVSRSLSELEFEELKGFLDLGFTFSGADTDADARLVSIVPGLQRLRNREIDDERGEGEKDEISISRPYLSEAWSFNRDDDRGPLTNWKISAVDDEINMKNQLRFWAHAVASTVR